MHHEVPNTQTVEANPNQHFSAQMSELEAKANELAKQGLSTSAIEHEMQALEHNTMHSNQKPSQILEKLKVNLRFSEKHRKSSQFHTTRCC